MKKTEKDFQGKKITVSNVAFVLVAVFLFLFTLSMILPFLWMVISSFKSVADYTVSTFSLPSEKYGGWHFENYKIAWELLPVRIVDWNVGYVEIGVFRMFLNSLILSGLGPLIGLIQPALTSYIVSKYKFKGSNFIYSLGIIVMILPVYGSLGLTLKFAKWVGYYDNLIFQVLLSGSPFGFTFIFFYGVFKTLPWSYAEAAFIDGASHAKVMFQIYFPLMLPIFATQYILSFIGSWSDYMTTTVMAPSWPTLGYGIYMFQQRASINGATVPQIMCGFIMMGTVTAILYLSTQKLLLEKMNVGGLKG